MLRSLFTVLFLLLFPSLAFADVNDFYIDELIKECDHSDPKRRALALEAFDKLVHIPPRVYDRLYEALEDKDSNSRKAAWDFLVFLSPRTKKYQARLLRHSQSRDMSDQTYALRVLWNDVVKSPNPHPKVIERFARAISHSDKHIRSLALGLFSRFDHSYNSPILVANLKSALEDPDPQIQVLALNAIPVINPVSKELFSSIFGAIKRNGANKAGSKTISYLGQYAEERKKLIPIFKEFLDLNYNLLAASEGLARLGSQKALNEIFVFLENPKKSALSKAIVTASLLKTPPQSVSVEEVKRLCKLFKLADDQKQSKFLERLGHALSFYATHSATIPGEFQALLGQVSINGRSVFCKVISRVGPKSNPPLKLLVPLLSRKETRSEAFQAVAKLEEKGRPFVPHLIELLQSDNSVQREVLNTLTELGPYAAAAIPDLLVALKKNKDVSIDSAARRTLASIGKKPKLVVPAICEAQARFTDSDPRYLSSFANSGFQELVYAFQKHKEETVRVAILRALLHTKRDFKLYKDLVLAALKSKEQTVVIAALKILQRVGLKGAEAKDIVLSQAAFKGAEFRSERNLALAAMGHRSAKFLREQQALVQNAKDDELKIAAAAILRQWTPVVETSKRAVRKSVFWDPSFNEGLFTLYHWGEKRLAYQILIDSIHQAESDYDHMPIVELLVRFGTDGQFMRPYLSYLKLKGIDVLSWLDDSKSAPSWISKSLDLRQCVLEGLASQKPEAQVIALEMALQVDVLDEDELKNTLDSLSRSQDLWLRLTSIRARIRLDHSKPVDQKAIRDALHQKSVMLKVEALRCLSGSKALAAEFINELITHALEENPLLQARAVEILSQIGPQSQATPKLVKTLLETKDSERQLQLLKAIVGLRGNTDAIVPLIPDFLKSKNRQLKQYALYALGLANKERIPALQLLTKALEQKDQFHRHEVINQLASLKAPVKQLKSILIEELKGRADSPAVNATLKALSMQEASRPIVLELLKSQDPKRRRAGIILALLNKKAVPQLGPRVAKLAKQDGLTLDPIILDLAQDLILEDNPFIPDLIKEFLNRENRSRDALQASCLKIAFSYLKAITKANSNTNALKALARVAKLLPTVERVRLGIRQQRKEPRRWHYHIGPTFSKVVLRARMKDQIQAILKHMQDKDPKVKIIVCKILGDLKWSSKEIVAALEVAANDSHKPLSEAARAALEKIHE